MELLALIIVIATSQPNGSDDVAGEPYIFRDYPVDETEPQPELKRHRGRNKARILLANRFMRELRTARLQRLPKSRDQQPVLVAHAD